MSVICCLFKKKIWSHIYFLFEHTVFGEFGEVQEIANFSFILATIAHNRPIQVKCVASVTKCGPGLERAVAPTGMAFFTNGKYWKFFRKLFYITRRQRLLFQLKDCVFPNDLTQYLSGYNPMIEYNNI
jgi:hypothetical protein